MTVTVPGPIYLIIVSAGGAAWGYLIGSYIKARRKNPVNLTKFLLEVQK